MAKMGSDRINHPITQEISPKTSHFQHLDGLFCRQNQQRKSCQALGAVVARQQPVEKLLRSKVSLCSLSADASSKFGSGKRACETPKCSFTPCKLRAPQVIPLWYFFASFFTLKGHLRLASAALATFFNGLLKLHFSPQKAPSKAQKSHVFQLFFYKISKLIRSDPLPSFLQNQQVNSVRPSTLSPLPSPLSPTLPAIGYGKSKEKYAKISRKYPEINKNLSHWGNGTKNALQLLCAEQGIKESAQKGSSTSTFNFYCLKAGGTPGNSAAGRVTRW
jgi:hypothetical protein